MAEYHLHAKTHSRGAGKGAGGHVRYILREGAYAQKTVEQVNGAVVERVRIERASEVAYAESGHLPAWAQTPAGYWDAADQYERANGTVYREIEFALPKELSDAENIALARSFAEHLADVPGGATPCRGATPYTLAIHRSEKKPLLLHCHLMLSDKVNDGIERDPSLWFRRASNPGKDPARGGAPKTQARIGQDWLGDVVRPLWERLANDALAHAEVDARIDHRSLEARRIEQEALAERAMAAGDIEGHLAALGRGIALDRPPEPKKGRVLTHAGPEKAPGQAGLVIQYEQARAARQEAAKEAAIAHVEALVLEEEQRQAQACRQVAVERLPRMVAAREKRLKREAILECAQLRHGYRMDSWEIRDRWSFRQQQREMEREAERLLEERERQEQEERALDDMVAEETASGVRHPQRTSWREWRAQTLSRKYDPVYSAAMAERDIYCRWMPEEGGLYLRLGKAEVIDQGPLLLAKNGDQDIPLLIETAKGKGWNTLEFTGSPDFKEKAAIAALQAGLSVADTDLAQRARAAIETQARVAAIEVRRQKLLDLAETLRADTDAKTDLRQAYPMAGYRLEEREGKNIWVYPHDDLKTERDAAFAARKAWDERKRARKVPGPVDLKRAATAPEVHGGMLVIGTEPGQQRRWTGRVVSISEDRKTVEIMALGKTQKVVDAQGRPFPDNIRVGDYGKVGFTKAGNPGFFTDRLKQEKGRNEQCVSNRKSGRSTPGDDWGPG